MQKYISIAKLVLNLAKSNGADKAQCTVSEGELREFNVEGNQFSLFRTTFNRAVSITVFCNGKKGQVALNSFDENEIKTAVNNCIDAANSSKSDKDWEIAKDIGEKDFCLGCLVPDTEKLFFRANELLNDIKTRHPLIIIEQMMVYHSAHKRVYMSTEGNTYTVQSGAYAADLMYSAHQGEKSTSFYSSDVLTDNLDKPFIDCAMIERELTDVENQLNTKPTEGKFTGTVIFTPACLAGTVFGNVCRNFVSDGALLEGTSIWKDKLFKQVADKRINVSFKPYDNRIVCGSRYTGEGYLTEDFSFIKDGKLQGFLISQYVANKTGFKRAPSQSGMVIEAGETPLEDIIKNTEKGVIIGRFSGGSPAANGEFSGVAKNGFLIENGKIVSALSETMISGNLAEMLNNLIAISKETLVDGSVVAPYMAFGGVTVSGK